MSMLNKFRTSQVICKLNKITRRGMAESKPDTSIKPHTEAAYTSPNSALGDVHRVSKVERYFLVWTKKFKSTKDVPGYVSRDMMEKARNIMRIRLNLSIIALCLIGALFAAKSGKKAAARGESVTKNNLQWHKDYNNSQNAQLPK
ncbi:UPF0389 protein CG9231-like [Daphnia carinata]|uniref:UPF0389 protein CG9231-like n=1 Tax=Daphnia carinata TaxID=120202 RepID=UPI0028696415|nr:UPF0389 protein CG9231-like [Daphnia carinata]